VPNRLEPPPEPKEIREALKALARASGPAPYIVFTGNRLAKYLWDHWAPQLRAMGLGWKDLLQALSRHSRDALAWVLGELDWESFTSRLAQDLEARAKKEARQRKTILDYF